MTLTGFGKSTFASQIDAPRLSYCASPVQLSTGSADIPPAPTCAASADAELCLDVLSMPSSSSWDTYTTIHCTECHITSPQEQWDGAAGSTVAAQVSRATSAAVELCLGIRIHQSYC